MFMSSQSKTCRLTHQVRNRVQLTRTRPLTSTIVCNDGPSPPEGAVKKKTFREEYRKWRRGPTFKYWFLGGSVFFSWMSYYGYKSYKKTRLSIDLPPPLPSHTLVQRDVELSKLVELCPSRTPIVSDAIAYLKGQGQLTLLNIAAPPAMGKTIFAHQFVELQMKKLEPFLAVKGVQLGIPKSKISAFLQADTEESFSSSLKAFAAKLSVTPAELDDVAADRGLFKSLLFRERCEVLLEAIQVKLKKHAGWVLVIDNLQSTTPPEIVELVNFWFREEESQKSWSRGMVLLVHNSTIQHVQELVGSSEPVLSLIEGLSVADCQTLLSKMVNIEESSSRTTDTEALAEKMFFNPLALISSAILLREKLARSEPISIKQAITELIDEIDASIVSVVNADSDLPQIIQFAAGKKLVTLQSVVAMAINQVLRKDPYLYHGFDLISACQPGVGMPQTLLTRHLRNTVYKLPPLIIKEAVLPGMSGTGADGAKADKKDDPMDPRGHAWSNKNLAEYLRTAEEWLAELYSAFKMLYDLLYGILPELPEKDDGLDMFRTCELLLTSKIEPGGSKAVSMHPVVYNAARQHFTSSTLYKFESDHLFERQQSYEHQPWFRKMSAFSEQACLQTFRDAARQGDAVTTVAGKPAKAAAVSPAMSQLLENAESYMSRYNFGISIGRLYEEPVLAGRSEGFWLPQATDQAVYLQNHLARVISSLAEEISVCREDVAGVASRRTLTAQLEYVLDNQPHQLLGPVALVAGLKSLAAQYVATELQREKGAQILREICQMQKSTEGKPLDLANTLVQLAEVSNTSQDFNEAKRLLEEAIDLYEADRKRMGEYKRVPDCARALGLLGVVYGSLGQKQLSKETLEKALMMLQKESPDLADEAKSKRYGADFASALTDLGHAYVLLGLPLYGKKILDLALAAHKNLHGDAHTEVVRALTLLGTAHLMQGNNQESKRLRKEAAKAQKAMRALPQF